MAVSFAALAVTVAADYGSSRRNSLWPHPRLIATAPTNCRGSFDVYRYTAAVLRTCGYRVFPLTAIRTLPGGGHAYRYSDGSTQLVSPPGFEPLKATSAQLYEYGLPPRPTDPAALANWVSEMSGRKGVVRPPPFIVADPYFKLGDLPPSVRPRLRAKARRSATHRAR